MFAYNDIFPPTMSLREREL